ncbi:LacI family DNA-binding transcriptional regulator [Alicyclobacillus sp. SO9]|uniref:LacI family DNA-binding transcriptional regulator n=1 Tax=Alicyclobacillus sp. SO9 TaxID=2665646 RepID=UPI0018E73D0F|nr:LacI family DNA-binding transcriptional regulator [Alicyclobacillus sp. SO9]QQE77928.1 LacI family DNA-binding transcriptional regulator [Alicyclobacillus sp. SO9]
MAKMEDVARHASVSKMTVSRFINGTGPVKAETRTRILRAMEELDYQPRRFHCSTAMAAERTLMLIVADISNPFFSLMARGVEHVANNSGYHVIVGNTAEDETKEQELINLAVSYRVKGVILTPVSDNSAANIHLLKQKNIPFAFVDRELDGFHADVVKGDIVHAAQSLVEYLIGLGHERIAVVTGPLNSASSRERLEGYKRALAHHHIPYRSNYVKQALMTRDMSTSFVHELLDQPKRPTALFVANLFQHAHTVLELRKLQIRIPEDLSIVSFRNTDDLAAIDSNVTSAVQPAYNFGSLSAQLLIERIEGKRQAPTKIVLQSTIIEDGSTGSPTNMT